MSTTGPLQPLLHEARTLLSQIDESMAQSFVGVIDAVVGSASVANPTTFPLGTLPDLEAQSTNQTLATTRAVIAAADEIEWYQSDASRVPPGWVQHSAAAQLVSPDGMIVGPDQNRLGLFYLSPELHYPDHWHDAEEFYLVLSGHAHLTIDGQRTTAGPGDYTRTPSRAIHHIVTDDQPMFALWGWAGDTSFDSYAY